MGQTRVLSLNGEEVEETEISGFASDLQTFYCGNAIHDQIVQVTSVSARLVSAQSKTLLAEWRPPTEKNISVVATNWEQIMVSTGSDLYYLEIHPAELVLKGCGIILKRRIDKRILNVRQHYLSTCNIAVICAVKGTSSN